MAKRAGQDSKLLPPGTKAPDFTLHVTPDQTLALSDLAGKPVVLAFYPADWSPVCGDQMALYNEALPEFEHMAPQSSVSPSMGRGVMTPSPRLATSTFRCSPIWSRRERRPGNTAPIARVTASANVRCS